MKQPKILSITAESLGSLFYPYHCVVCMRNVAAGITLCDKCVGEAPRIKSPFCRACSQPYGGEGSEPVGICHNCGNRHFHFQCAVSRYKSLHLVRDLIHRFKYRGDFYLRHQLASWLIEGFCDARIQETAPQAFVPVPLYPARLRQREYNQSQELALLLCKSTGIACMNALRRLRSTATQTRLSRQQRMENLRNAFEMRKDKSVLGMHLLLIDDVFTTGSTADECSRVLMTSGAASVRVLTVARG